MADIGYIAMVTALTAAIYGMLIPHLGVVRNNWNLVRSAQFATIFNFFLLSLASGVLIYAFLTHNYQILYVWETSSRDMPLFYKVTAFWGGLNGSLLFWAWVQSLVAMIVAFRYQHSNRQSIPYVIATLNFIMVFLLTLLVIWSSPFELQAVIPPDGRGLNPLLQNIAMTAHPPSLYLGFIGFSVPFAFAIGGLLSGKLDNEWILTTRRWTLLSWYFLSLGIIIGGQWAYEELGWGGYWAWDPVENASFMPWLTGTAFLHSVMMQEKRNMLKVWNITLIIITFGLSILGTFLTRSGVVNSVHSFTQSEIGPFFLVFLGFTLLISFGMLFWRMKILESDHRMESVMCRENVFLAQNIMFVGIMFTVLLGTTFPLLAEAIRGTKLSIQAPFFNTITAPMGYMLFFMMGIGTLIAWRRSSLESLRKNFLPPAIVATIGMFSLIYVFGNRIEALLIIWISCFVTTTILIELTKATGIKARQTSTNYMTAFVYVIMRNTRRYGGLTIHVGVIFVFIGFAGRFLDFETEMTLELNRPTAVQKYQVLFKGVEEFPVRNATHRAARLEVYRGENLVDVMLPARSFYPTQPEPLTEVAIYRSFWEDFYVILHNEDPKGQWVTLKIHINPLVGWAWMALPIFTIGIGLSLSYRPKTMKVRHEAFAPGRLSQSTPPS